MRAIVRVVLDTVPALAASLRLYTGLGFVPIEPWAGVASGAICLARGRSAPDRASNLTRRAQRLSHSLSDARR